MDWNFVSDLGVPGPPTMFMGHAVHSPLPLLMNTAFVVNGALVILAAALLLYPRGKGRLANWQRWLVIGGHPIREVPTLLGSHLRRHASIYATSIV